MAAREDQSQHVVAENLIAVGVGNRLLRVYLCLGLQIAVGTPLQNSASQSIDGLVPTDIDQPGARVRRHALRRPLLNGGRKCFLPGVFGQFEITDEADQRREDATRLTAEHAIEGLLIHCDSRPRDPGQCVRERIVMKRP